VKEDPDRIDLRALDFDAQDRTRRYFGPFYDRIQEHPVLVVGAGAVGTEVVKNLAMLGVRTIHLVDFDKVSGSNLNRCVFFRPEDHGRTHKVDAVAREVRARWPSAEIVPWRSRIQDAPEDVWRTPLALVCVDNNEARHYVNLRALASDGIFVVNGATGRSFLEVQTLLPGVTPCMLCCWGEEYFENLVRRIARESCDEFFHRTAEHFPAISVLNSLTGAIMAGEAAKILVGLPGWRRDGAWEEDHVPFLGKGLRYDIRAHEFDLAPLRRNPKCVEVFCRSRKTGH
jgi:adenylyltransferase/sulfurtransferase